MIDEAKFYDTVKDVLFEEFAIKPDPQRAIKNAQSLKLCRGQSASEFAVIAEKRLHASRV